MSQENVDLVVSAIERWNCGDDTGTLESFAPDVEVHHNIGRGTPLEGVYHGHTEVRKLWSDIRESFAEARFDIDRATAHDGVVLVLGTLRLRGTGSGALADTPFGVVTEFEHGLGRRQFFWTGDQSSALEAVGLRA